MLPQKGVVPPTLLPLWAGACALMFLPDPTAPRLWFTDGGEVFQRLSLLFSFSQDCLWAVSGHWLMPSLSQSLQNVLVCGWYLSLVYLSFLALWSFGQ